MLFHAATTPRRSPVFKGNIIDQATSSPHHRMARPLLHRRRDRFVPACQRALVAWLNRRHQRRRQLQRRQRRRRQLRREPFHDQVGLSASREPRKAHRRRASERRRRRDTPPVLSGEHQGHQAVSVQVGDHLLSGQVLQVLAGRL